MTLSGAISGIITGAVIVVLWENVQLLSNSGIYSILPAFIIALLVIITVSLIDKEPIKEVENLFDKATKTQIAEEE